MRNLNFFLIGIVLALGLAFLLEKCSMPGPTTGYTTPSWEPQNGAKRRYVLLPDSSLGRLSTPCLPGTLRSLGNGYSVCERSSLARQDSWKPDISHCFHEPDLWDCIRYEKGNDNHSSDRSARSAHHEVGDVDGDARRKAQVRSDI